MRSVFARGVIHRITWWARDGRETVKRKQAAKASSTTRQLPISDTEAGFIVLHYTGAAEDNPYTNCGDKEYAGGVFMYPRKKTLTSHNSYKCPSELPPKLVAHFL